MWYSGRIFEHKVMFGKSDQGLFLSLLQNRVYLI